MNMFERVLLLSVLLALGMIQARADAWDEWMTAAERESTGVERLSAGEREALYLWLQGFIAGAAADFDAAPRTAGEPDEIRSRIAGTFRGWTGQTVFRLENGQVWQQRRPSRLLYEAERPEVVIRRNRAGFHSMEVPEAERSVLVQRIEE